jgi:hypothetical protein
MQHPNALGRSRVALAFPSFPFGLRRRRGLCRGASRPGDLRRHRPAGRVNPAAAQRCAARRRVDAAEDRGTPFLVDLHCPAPKDDARAARRRGKYNRPYNSRGRRAAKLLILLAPSASPPPSWRSPPAAPASARRVCPRTLQGRFRLVSAACPASHASSAER